NERSGSLRTVNHAIEQGRDIFAVPGDITSSMNMGTNKLLREGAKPVFNAMDVLEEYAERFPDLLDIDKIETTLKTEAQRSKSAPKKAQPFEKPIVSQKISDKARLVCDAFNKEIMQADELILSTGLSAVEFMSAMTELELLGVIEPLAGKNYKIITQIG
ncbi:MAG TPA: hypothetical protein DCY31_08665, partial [Ruminococcaceae bacterium]|nr:hypothetical protein [Oscillospiraceae bacterium]